MERVQVVLRQMLEIPDFRKRLRLMMARRGFTMVSLAAKLGIDHKRLWLKLDVGRMTERSLVDIERALGIDRSAWTEPLAKRRTEEEVRAFMSFVQISAARKLGRQRGRRAA